MKQRNQITLRTALIHNCTKELHNSTNFIYIDIDRTLDYGWVFKINIYPLRAEKFQKCETRAWQNDLGKNNMLFGPFPLFPPSFVEIHVYEQAHKNLQ